MTMEQKTNNFECYDITVVLTEFYSISKMVTYQKTFFMF